jgi:hypothetical protein
VCPKLALCALALVLGAGCGSSNPASPSGSNSGAPISVRLQTNVDYPGPTSATAQVGRGLEVIPFLVYADGRSIPSTNPTNVTFTSSNSNVLFAQAGQWSNCDGRYSVCLRVAPLSPGTVTLRWTDTVFNVTGAMTVTVIP